MTLEKILASLKKNGAGCSQEKCKPNLIPGVSSIRIYPTVIPKPSVGRRRTPTARSRRAFVETHGLHLAETLQDLGISAFRGDNAQTGELGRFLQRIENGEIPPSSVLVAESLDRLTPPTVWMKQCCFCSTSPARGQNRTHCAKRHPGSLLVRGLLPAPGGHYGSKSKSEQKSFRSLAVWQTKCELAKAGVIVTKQVPRWFEVRDGKIHMLEERAQLGRRIIDMYVSGSGAASSPGRLSKSVSRHGTRGSPRGPKATLTSSCATGQ